MPKLPDIAEQESPVPNPGGGVVSYRPVSGAETAVGEAQIRFGQTVSRFGETIGGVGDALHRKFKEEEERVNTLRAEEAFSKLRERQLDLTIGEQTGYANVRGSDAVGRPLAKEWMEKFDQGTRQIEQSLANEEQKEMYRRRVAVARLQYGEGIITHLAKQREEYGQQVYSGTLAGEVQQAGASWDNPANIGLSLERIRAAVYRRADEQGLPDEYRDALFQEEASKVHAAVIGQALASGNPEYAKTWYEQHREDVDPVTAKTFEASIAAEASKQIVSGYTAEMLSSPHNPAALLDVESRFMADDRLDQETKNRLMERVIHFENRNERLAEKALKERQDSAFFGYFLDIDQGGGDPAGLHELGATRRISPEQFQTLRGALDKRDEGRDDAQAVFNLQTAIDSASPTELEYLSRQAFESYKDNRISRSTMREMVSRIDEKRRGGGILHSYATNSAREHLKGIVGGDQTALGTFLDPAGNERALNAVREFERRVTEESEKAGGKGQTFDPWPIADDVIKRYRKNVRDDIGARPFPQYAIGEDRYSLDIKATRAATYRAYDNGEITKQTLIEQGDLLDEYEHSYDKLRQEQESARRAKEGR